MVVLLAYFEILVDVTKYCISVRTSEWDKIVCVGLKAASHRIRFRLTIRLVANGSLHTGSVGSIRVNFLGFDWLPAYLKSA